MALSMSKETQKEHLLPSREISHAYTVAMHFGQQLELNLRAILYTTDYHGWGDSIELNECQLKRFKDANELIDKGTCGLIIEKLRQARLLNEERALKAFKDACEHRNKLAHSFLAEIDFNEMTSQKEAGIIARLHSMTADMYLALLISRAVRERAELSADELDRNMQRLFAQYLDNHMMPDPNRHYATRIRKTKNV
jgi:hypothetical protein